MRSRTAKPQRPPAFQFYVRDFLADEKIQLMPTEAVGPYIFLLCQAWLSDPPCTLPDDDPALAKLSRLGEHWPQHMVQLRACFKSANGRLIAEELQTYYLELLKHRKERAESGRKGAFRRWSKHGTANGSAITNDGPASASAVSSSSINPLSPTSGGNSLMQKNQGRRADGTNPRALAAKEAKIREREKQQRQLAALHDVPSEDDLPTLEDIRRAKEEAGLVPRTVPSTRLEQKP